MRDFSSFSHKHALLPPASVKPPVIDSLNENSLPYYFDHYSHLHDDYGSVTFEANSSILKCVQGKGTGSGKAGKREEELHLSLFYRQINGGQKANFFLYARPVKHISHYSLWYSNLDSEKQKALKSFQMKF